MKREHWTGVVAVAIIVLAMGAVWYAFGYLMSMGAKAGFGKNDEPSCMTITDITTMEQYEAGIKEIQSAPTDCPK